MERNVITKSAFFAVGAIFGAGAMFVIIDKQNKRKYRDIAESEIESVKKTWSLISGEIKDPREELNAHLARLDELDTYEKTVDSLDYRAISEEASKTEADEAKVEEVSVGEFAQPSRPESGPYVITLDEFMLDDDEFEKISVVYYHGDLTLVDDREEPIDNIKGTIGEESLKYFGYESDDPNTVYVRSPNLGTDFEVVRNPGTYSEEVLGLHADPGKLRDDG